MHQLVINLCDLLLLLWRGQMKLYGLDKKDAWDWVVFMDSQCWKEHGREVASMASFFPSSFGHPPQNPAEKLSSSYKAWELLLYVYGLGLCLLWSPPQQVLQTLLQTRLWDLNGLPTVNIHWQPRKSRFHSL